MNEPVKIGWPIQKLAIEVFSIVLGVLLALGVNEFREQRLHRIQAESAMHNIKLEIQSNFDFLTLVHKNNTATLDAMSGEGQSDSDGDRSFVPGLQIDATAWETLLSTGISNYVDYESILLLSKMYSVQDIYKQTGGQLTEAAMNMASYATVLEKEIDNEQFGHQFMDYFSILVQIETALLQSYKGALEHLEQKP